MMERKKKYRKEGKKGEIERRGKGRRDRGKRKRKKR